MNFEIDIFDKNVSAKIESFNKQKVLLKIQIKKCKSDIQVRNSINQKMSKIINIDRNKKENRGNVQNEGIEIFVSPDENNEIIILNVILLSISLSLELPEKQCNISAQGISSKQASQFEQLLNRIRNEVAMGRRANHKGQIECAADMHMISWSKDMAKKAQECSDTCPEQPIFCRNMKGLTSFMIHKLIVHTQKWEWDAEFVLNEWMQSQNSAQQLLQSMLFQVGCGRSLTPVKDKFLMYTVCFFDYPNRMNPYRPAPSINTAGSCKLGKSSSHIGLCISPYSKDQQLIWIKQESRIIQSK
ncbi:unnamed protein product [Paramecium sonneborni]|uniref:SCP domain-containing protein n=1 Tax=Paramecium sonneborni TaxID=65129 RepID=A0A8S1MM61_9CILI|nr:unnamed protein product [Paramecium sonneborni]